MHDWSSLGPSWGAPAAWSGGAAGVSHDGPESPNVYFGGPQPSNIPPKLNEKSSQKGKNERFLGEGRERENKERHFGRSKGRVVQGKGRSREMVVQGDWGSGTWLFRTSVEGKGGEGQSRERVGHHEPKLAKKLGHHKKMMENKASSVGFVFVCVFSFFFWEGPTSLWPNSFGHLAQCGKAKLGCSLPSIFKDSGLSLTGSRLCSKETQNFREV